MTVDEMLDRMSAEEFFRWELLYQKTPFGDLRDEIHFSKLYSMISNLTRPKDAKVLQVKDFMWSFVDHEERQKELDVEQNHGFLRSVGLSPPNA